MERRESKAVTFVAGIPIISGAVLQKPRRKDGKIVKGVVILNQCDEVSRRIPDFKDYFYIVERRGWNGKSVEEAADVKLVDDLGTLDETRERFPRAISLPYANADFVDTDLFYPLGQPKPYTGLQISAWQEFKRHDLFVKAASLLRADRFLKFGHYWGGISDTSMTKGERELRDSTIALAKELGARNIDFLFTNATSNVEFPNSADGVNGYINMAHMGILTTAGEGVNRFKMECLAANIPVLVPADAHETTKKHINERTGRIYTPTPEGLAHAIMLVKSDLKRFSPRKYLLAHSGKHRAVRELRKALQTISRRDGAPQSFEDVTWDGRNQSLIWDEGECLRAFREAIRNASS